MFVHKKFPRLIALVCSIALSVTVLCGCTAKHSAGTTAKAGLTVTCLNVGKADATLLQSAGTNVLIDTGTAVGAEELISSLEDLQVDTLDLLILTHFDQDHVGGAAAVLASFQTDEVITTYQSKTSDEIDAYTAAMEDAGLSETVIRETTTFSVGDVSYTIYPPLETAYDTDTSNNSSLVTYITYGDDTFLFCGDIEKDRLKELLAENITLSAEFIKMPHHGTYYKKLGELLDLVSPEIAVISTSTDQLADQETINLLDAADVAIYQTYNGNITIHTEGNGLSVTQ